MTRKKRAQLGNRLRQLGSLLSGGLALPTAVRVAAMDSQERGMLGSKPASVPTDFALSDQLPATFVKTRSRLNDASPREQGALLTQISELLDPTDGTDMGVGLVGANFIVLTLISLMVSIFVVPQFQELFDTFGSGLPTPTIVALYFTRWVLLPLSVLAVLLGVVVIIWQRSRQFELMMTRLDALSRRVPFFGRLVIARETRQLASWLAVCGTGPSTERSVECMAELISSPVLARRLARVSRGLANGVGVADAFSNTDWLPGLSQVLRDYPDDPTALTKYAASLELSVEKALDRFTWAAQLIGGIVVGFMVAAIYLPIFKMGSVV